MSLLLAAMLSCQAPAHAGEKSYPETGAVLREAYSRELKSHLVYIAYTRQARAEGYRNIALLFIGMVVSKAVHARNSYAMLNELGIAAQVPRREDDPVAGTRENLNAAAQAELREIERDYPDALKRAGPEGHTAALMDLSHALECAKQHRALFEEAGSFPGLLSGMLARFIDKARLRLFVCDICGSTVDRQPRGSCPVCRGPASAYHEVSPIAF
jgi:rubrerythrin